MKTLEEQGILTKKSHILFLAVFIGLLLILGGYIYYKHSVEVIQQDKENELKSIAELKIRQIVEWHRERISDAKVISCSPFFIDAIKEWLKNQNDKKLENEIKIKLQLPQEEYGYEAIFLSSNDGKILLSVGYDLQQFEYADIPKILESVKSEQITFTDFYYCDIHQKIHNDMIAPILDKFGNVIAVLIFRTDPKQYIYPLVQEWPIASQTAQMYLVKKDGNDALCLTERKFHKDAPLNLRISLDRKESPSVQAVLGTTGIFYGLSLRGTEVMSYLNSVPGTNWFLVAQVDKSEILSEVKFTGHSLVIFIALLLTSITIGLIWIYNYRQRNIYKKLWQTQQEYKTTIESIGDAVITTDKGGIVRFINPVAEKLTGWKESDAVGKPLEMVFNIINEETRNKVENPVNRVLQEGLIVGLANHTILISKDGIEIPIADSGAPIRSETGEIYGVVLVFRDQTEERLHSKLINLRLKLFEYSANHSLSELLTKTLDEVEELTKSQIGFFHFVDDDQEFLSLQAWSTRTKNVFCKAQGTGAHYKISQAGVWVDCFYQKKPVIHNDYVSLPHKKGMPDGHTPVIRELVVPILRNDKVVAILGIGNKLTEYTQKDVEIVNYVADVCWEIVEQKRANEKLFNQYQLLTAIKRAHDRFISTESIRETFDNILSDVLSLTNSKYGFIGEVLFTDEGQPYLKTHAITNISWNEETKKFYEEYAPKGMEFYNLNTLFGEVLKTGEPLIANNPSEHPKRGGIPPGHPPLNSFLGIPIKAGNKPIAMIGIANRPGGYSEDILEYLQPLLGTFGQLVETYRNITARQKVQSALQESESKLRHIVEHSTNVFYSCDTNHIIQYISPQVKNILGYDVNEALVKWTEFLSDNPMNEIGFEKAVAAIETGIAQPPYELELVHKDGHKVWVEVREAPLVENGKTVAVVGSLTDISERKRVQNVIEENEKKYRTVVENIFEALIIENTEGRLVWANKAFTKIFGYTEEEIPYLTLKDYTADSSYEEVIERHRKRMRGEEVPEQFIYKGKRKDGTEIWVEARVTVLKENGKIIGSQSLERDITARKLAEEELVRMRKQYERLFMEDLTGVFISTIDGKIITCNPSFLKIFGFKSMEEAIATNARVLYRSVNDREKLISRLQRERKLENYEIEMVKRDGTPLYIIANLIGRFDSNDKLFEIQGYVVDDTKRRKLEETLIHTQKMESIGTLAGGIAHDFNNILGIILGHCAMVEKNFDEPEKLKKSIEAIATASKRGASLVKQLLTIARKSDTTIDTVYINQIINEIKKLAHETFPKTIEFITVLDDQLPAIDADATQLHQVFINLCVNARDAMPSGGKLTITTSKIDGDLVRKNYPNAFAKEYVLVTVEDTGVGMTDEVRKRIFEPFFTTKGIGRGTGLGLSLVYSIVENHRGYIEVSSEVGKGTEFRIYFPVPERMFELVTEQPQIDGELPGGTETVLIIEDEEMLRDLLKAILSSAGYKVLVANDGEDGFSMYMANRQKIDVVISDLGLPKFPGDEVFRKIKSFDPTIKFILASGFINPELKSELFKLGIMRIIQKPYTTTDVLRTIRDVLDINI